MSDSLRDAGGRLAELVGERILLLEGLMGEPGFWDAQERAARITAEHARDCRALQRWLAVSEGTDG